MSSDSIAVFLPVRKGSKRVEKKNTRPFAGFQNGLLELKLQQLIKTQKVDQIIVSSNDSDAIEIAEQFSGLDKRVNIINRPDSLSDDHTKLTDLIKYVPSITSANHILWTHVTSPFVTFSRYDEAIAAYFKGFKNGFDSLMSVTLFQNFLWDPKKNDILNRNSNLRWPRTQDLQKLYEINSALFIAERSSYVNESDRIGNKPQLFLMDKTESMDIDWEEDFEMAELIYKRKYV